MIYTKDDIQVISEIANTVNRINEFSIDKMSIDAIIGYAVGKWGYEKVLDAVNDIFKMEG